MKRHSSLSSRCAALAAGILIVLLRHPIPAATFAPGFSESTLSAGWNEAVGLIFGRNPDGTKQRMYVWERAGRLWIVEDGVRLAAPLLDISDEVAGYRDHGMLGFALDPNFTTNGHFYVMYVVDRHHLDFFGTGSYNPATNDYFKPTIGRITRYTARLSDDRRTADPASRLVLLGETKSTGFPVLHESHSVGTLFFGADGTLLATCGDGASYNAMDNGHQAGGAYGDAGVMDGIITAAENIGAFRVQLLDSHSGKMIRIDPATGNGVSSNPYYQAGSPRSARSRLWARGLRNPFRFTKKPGTGSASPAEANPGVFFIGDVGWYSSEDMQVSDVGGRNFGWPIYEGMFIEDEYYPARPAGMDAADHMRPIAEWRTGRAARVNVGGTVYSMGAAGNPVTGPSFNGNCSVGGTWYTGTDFPVEFQNTYFHAEFGDGWIKSFTIGANNEIQAIRHFASSAGGVVFVTTHPETGGLYYIPWGGTIMKVEFVGGTPPLSKACAHRSWGPSPLTVNFSSLGSADPNGGSLRYLWDFGDGVTSTLANPSHTYTAGAATLFNATLTVYTSAGFEHTSTVPIHVNNTAPRVRITSPVNLTHYPLDQGNVTYALTADVSDAETANGALTYSWVTSLHHDEHHHDEPGDPYPSTTTVITPHGPGNDPHGSDAVYYYEIHLTVTDPQGLSTTDTVRLVPDVGTLPVTTVADSATVNRGGGVWIAVLANDFGGVTDANFASIQIVSAPTHGTATLDPLIGQIRYVNNGDSSETDAFTYRVTTIGGTVSAIASVSIAVSQPTNGTTTAIIAGEIGDVEEPPTGALNTTSTDLDLGLGDDDLGWTVGMRFGALAVPQGSKITAASIQFTTDNSPASTTPVSLTIRGEAADSAGIFDDAYARPSFRPVTTSSTAWAPPAWPTVGQRGANQLTPNLSAIVQEIVNREGWASGNNLALFITGTGHVEGESYDGAVAVGNLGVAPQLSVTFDGWNHRPLARSDTASVNGGQAVTINVAANDVDPENLLAASSVLIDCAPAHGWLTVNPGTGQITYTNDGAPNPSDSFTYTVADSTGARSAPATVFVQVAPAPIQVTEWSAFNDQTAGANTHANATAWSLFGTDSGLVRNIATGANLPVTLSHTNAGAAGAGSMSAPNAGTPAAVLFSPYVNWAEGGTSSAQIETGDTVTYAFTGLNPARTYTFRATGVRGGGYANRWTRAEIQSAVSQTAAHTGGVLTSTQQPTFLNATQAAWNSGENRVGDVIGWDAIDPGADGTFSIVLTKYVGDYPGGNASSAMYGYAFQAIRLQQVQTGPAEPPTTAPDSTTMHHNQKVLLDVLANDTGFIDPATVAIVSPPSSGTASPNAQGRILYTHTTGAPISDSFTYRVSGVGGTSGPATVSVNFATALRIANPNLNVPSQPPPTTFALVPAFATNPIFDQPLAVASPPGDTQRLFVCEKTGLLRVIANVTAANPAPTTVLHLPALLTSRGETLLADGEQGLLSVAFHPNYATNRFFYVFYSVNGFRPGTTTLVNAQRVSRFTMQAGNPLVADTASELVLIQQEDEASNHNGGSLNFGPDDGYLYISVGDEGGGDDNFNNSQKINGDFFSAMLRIDVDKKPGSLNPNNHLAVLRDGGVARYAVPPNNPWVGATSFNGLPVTPSTVRTEFWAVGLRNPWRTAFDPVTGELWCADVGQNLYEEVDILTAGGNYGWAYREGLHPGPKAPVAGFVGVDPIYEYNHTGLAGDPNFKGNSVTGGVVYRGNRFASLVGAYVFADYVSGNIWSLRRNVSGPPTVERLAGEGGIAGFGVDPSNGDVLLADLDSGVLRRLIVNDAPGSTFPQNLSDTRLFSDLSDLSPAPGLLPYSINLPFWSDHGIKRRWFIVPDGIGDFTYNLDHTWGQPDGTVWVKHFDLDLTRGNPATRRRIETRLLVKNAAGVYGVSYRWNPAQTEATLAPDEGVDIPLNIIENGNPRVQTWRIPSRGDCLTCHTPQAGHALSFNTRQLNLSGNMNGFTGNQIALLEGHGFLTNSAGSPNVLPRHVRPDETDFTVEGRVRSYFAVNCANCHRPGGTAAPAAWDGRAHVTLAQTGLINGAAINNQGNPLNKLVVPGDTTHSVVLNRMAVTNGFTRMPPLASNELDTVNIALVTDWITNSLPARQTYDQWRQQHFGNTTSPDGAPGIDAEGDGMTNEAEFITGTDPFRGDSALRLTPIANGGNLVLQFNLPANRSFRIECTTDFATWLPLDAPDNNGLPFAAGPVEIVIPIDAEKRFYRARMWEN